MSGLLASIMQNQIPRRLFSPKDLLATSCLGLITLWFFGDIVIKGHLLWGSDFITTYLPYKQFLYEEIQRLGSIPLWNPYLFGGMPFWGFFESTIFYPFDLPFWFISPEKTYGYTMALHIFMGSLFMYALGLTFRLSRWASLFAAMMFSYNNFIIPVLSLGRMVHVQSYTWMPLVLCLFVRSFESKRPISSAILTGLCWGLQIMAADPQTAFYTYGALVLFSSVYYSPIGSPKRSMEAIKILLIVFAFGFGLSAVQLIPALELARLSTRGVMKTYELVTLASFPPQGIITLFMPHFFGNLYDDNFWIANMPWSMPEFNLYVGILPLILIFFVKFRPINREKLSVFCAIVALVSLILALGKHTPIYKLVCLLPGFDSFRAPSKIIALWTLAISLLAAKALDDFMNLGIKKPSWKWIALAAIAIFSIIMNLWFFMDEGRILKYLSCFMPKPISPDHLAHASQIIHSQFHRMSGLIALGIALLYLRSKRLLSKNLWITLCLIILSVDLCGLNHRYIQTSDLDYEYLQSEKKRLTKALENDKEIYRVGGIGSPFAQNIEMYYGLQSVTGVGPLILYRYYLYCDYFYQKVAPPGWQVLRYGTPGSKKFMDILNVKYEIDYKHKKIYRRKNYMPRAFLVSDFKILPSSKMLSFMDSNHFKPRTTALFEQNPFAKGLTYRTPESNREAVGKCKILRYRPDVVWIEVKANQDTFLVLNDIDYPGWKCLVDGVPQKLLRCNYLFRAVRVQKGNHFVVFTFEPFLVTLGIGITIGTLILSLLILFTKKLS